jgi:hypothetical protein
VDALRDRKLDEVRSNLCGIGALAGAVMESGDQVEVVLMPTIQREAKPAADIVEEIEIGERC